MGLLLPSDRGRLYCVVELTSCNKHVCMYGMGLLPSGRCGGLSESVQQFYSLSSIIGTMFHCHFISHLNKTEGLDQDAVSAQVKMLSADTFFWEERGRHVTSGEQLQRHDGARMLSSTTTVGFTCDEVTRKSLGARERCRCGKAAGKGTGGVPPKTRTLHRGRLAPRLNRRLSSRINSPGFAGSTPDMVRSPPCCVPRWPQHKCIWGAPAPCGPVVVVSSRLLAVWCLCPASSWVPCGLLHTIVGLGCCSDPKT